MRLSHLLAAACLVPLAAIAASCEDSGSGETLCDPGANVFCRCRGGGAGTKACNDSGDGFGACETLSGECEEIEDPTTSSGNGSGGGEPIPAPPGELLGPCTQDSECKDGMICPMGYCTKPCTSYEECGDGDCVNWNEQGGPICMPYCLTQNHCEPYGMASRCGYTNEAVPGPFDVVVCAHWGDNLQLPPDGYPPFADCVDDALCNLGFEGVERVCDDLGCTDGCHEDTDCSGDESCDSPDGVQVGTCGGGTPMENGDDCPGIPLSISLSNPDVSVQGNTAQALPPSEHAVGMPCFASMNPPSEELVYAVSIGSSGSLIVDLSTTDTSFDPQLYARHTSCATGTQLACSDEIGGGKGEIIEFQVFQGETIWVFVDGWQGSTGSFTLSMNLSP